MSGPAKASPGGMSGPVWTCLDLSGPVQEDKYLLQTSGNTFFSQKLHLSFFYKQIYHFSIKMYHFQSQDCFTARSRCQSTVNSQQILDRPFRPFRSIATHFDTFQTLFLNT